MAEILLKNRHSKKISQLSLVLYFLKNILKNIEWQKSYSKTAIPKNITNSLWYYIFEKYNYLLKKIEWQKSHSKTAIPKKSLQLSLVLYFSK